MERPFGRCQRGSHRRMVDSLTASSKIAKNHRCTLPNGFGEPGVTTLAASLIKTPRAHQSTALPWPHSSNIELRSTQPCHKSMVAYRLNIAPKLFPMGNQHGCPPHESNCVRCIPYF
eukprot:581476-Amphidinium_carterae.1